MLHDKCDHPYARIAEVTKGTRLRVDGGFTCMKTGDIKLVHSTEDDKLFIECDEGAHMLCGQCQDDYYLGLYPAS